jgi:hypothetical protein
MSMMSDVRLGWQWVRIRTGAKAIDGSGCAEEWLGDLLLLLDENGIGLGELGEALDGCDASTCFIHTHIRQSGGTVSIMVEYSRQTDVSQEDQERQ